MDSNQPQPHFLSFRPIDQLQLSFAQICYRSRRGWANPQRRYSGCPTGVVSRHCFHVVPPGGELTVPAEQVLSNGRCGRQRSFHRLLCIISAVSLRLLALSGSIACAYTRSLPKRNRESTAADIDRPSTLENISVSIVYQYRARANHNNIRRIHWAT